MISNFLAGLAFLTTMVLACVAFWAGLTYYPAVMLILTAAITIVQAYRVHIERPSRNFRAKWLIFWYDNQWLKLVLLFTAMWLVTKYV